MALKAKRSDPLNKILTRTYEKECNGKNKPCNVAESKSKISAMYKDMYDDVSTIYELKYADFEIDEKTKSIKCIHPMFQHTQRGMIVFYAPWCKHCNQMYDDLVEISINYMNIFPIGVVNIEDIKNKNDHLSAHAKVMKYPTMKIVNRDLYLEDYNNDMSKDNIVYFINMNL